MIAFLKKITMSRCMSSGGSKKSIHALPCVSKENNNVPMHELWWFYIRSLFMLCLAYLKKITMSRCMSSGGSEKSSHSMPCTSRENNFEVKLPQWFNYWPIGAWASKIRIKSETTSRSDIRLCWDLVTYSVVYKYMDWGNSNTGNIPSRFWLRWRYKNDRLVEE